MIYSTDMDTPDVAMLAQLAKLAIPESEIPARVADIQAILSYVGQIQAVDLSTVVVHPMYMSSALRDDEVVTDIATDSVTAQFPDRQGAYLKVPAVLKK